MKGINNIPKKLKIGHKVSTEHGKATIIASQRKNNLVNLLLENGVLIKEKPYSDQPKDFRISDLHHVKERALRESIALDLPGLEDTTLVYERNQNDVLMRVLLKGSNDYQPFSIEGEDEADFYRQLLEYIFEKNMRTENYIKNRNEKRYASVGYYRELQKNNPNRGFLDPYNIVNKIFVLQKLEELHHEVPQDFAVKDATNPDEINAAANKKDIRNTMWNILCAERAAKIQAELKVYNEKMSKLLVASKSVGLISYEWLATRDKYITILGLAAIWSSMKELKRIGKQDYITEDMMKDFYTAYELFNKVKEKLPQGDYNMLNLVKEIEEMIGQNSKKRL